MNGLQYRKSVRDAVIAALDASFNTTHAALATDYSVDPLAFDFTNASRNVVQCRISPTEIELGPLLDLNPAGLAIYTTQAIDTGRIRGIRFDGAVLFGICGIYQPRDGAEGTDTESILDAFEDAVLLTLNAYQWPVSDAMSLIFSRETTVDRSPVTPLDNGWRQWFELIGKVQVRVL